jgi:uncharacterized protein (TIGR03086 family)
VSTLSDLSPAEEFAAVAGRFGELTAAASQADWDRPAPVPGWAARDVVRHLIEWFPGFLHGGAGITLPPVPSVDDDPAAAWSDRSRDIAALLADPGDRELTDPHIGSMPLSQAIDQFFTSDVFLHTWDLARALDQDPELDPDRCRTFLAGAEPFEDAMRSSGQYGPRVEVAPDAPLQDRVAGFIGRDPGWRPES